MEVQDNATPDDSVILSPSEEKLKMALLLKIANAEIMTDAELEGHVDELVRLNIK